MNREATIVLKDRIVSELDALPAEGLEQVAHLLDDLRFRLGRTSTPYTPVKLGGLWKGVRISNEDIAEARREMWATFGEREV